MQINDASGSKEDSTSSILGLSSLYIHPRKLTGAFHLYVGDVICRAFSKCMSESGNSSAGPTSHPVGLDSTCYGDGTLMLDIHAFTLLAYLSGY